MATKPGEEPRWLLKPWNDKWLLITSTDPKERKFIEVKSAKELDALHVLFREVQQEMASAVVKGSERQLEELEKTA